MAVNCYYAVIKIIFLCYDQKHHVARPYWTALSSTSIKSWRKLTSYNQLNAISDICLFYENLAVNYKWSVTSCTWLEKNSKLIGMYNELNKCKLPIYRLRKVNIGQFFYSWRSLFADFWHIMLLYTSYILMLYRICECNVFLQQTNKSINKFTD